MVPKCNDITWVTMLSSKDVVMSMMTCFLGTFNVTFFEGWITTELDNRDLSESATGYVIGGMSFVYLTVCLLFPYTCTKLPRRFLFTISMFGLGGCMLLIGPSKMFNFEDNLWVVIAGYLTLGLFQVTFFIPIIPEMIERLVVTLNIAEGADEYVDEKLNDKCNDAYGVVYAFTLFVSPLIGSSMYLKYTGPITCDTIAIVDFLYGLILLVFNCGPYVFSENRQFRKNLNSLKKKGE